MCGIAGIVSPGAPVASATLAAMTESLAHRGPDACGLFIRPSGAGSPHVGLGHRRLSILDLSDAGAQPMQSEDGAFTLVFNGEIYNYPDLRRDLEAAGHIFRSTSDTEAILRGYMAWGEGVVARLKGMFAFALWDERKRSLLLARDRFGKKPLHYAVTRQGTLLFASEPKALLAHPGFRPEPDAASLLHFLRYDYVPAPRSIYAGAAKLPPSHLMVWRDGRLEVRRYASLAFSGATGGRGVPLREAEAAVDALLDAAVQRRLASDVPLGVFLSGGLDSSTVLAYMTRHIPAHDIRTFAIGFDEASYDESAHAEAMARHAGSHHTMMRLPAARMLDLLDMVWATQDEPMADASIIPTLLLCRFAREHITVALGGDGGDELFAGYDPVLADLPARCLDWLPPAALRLLQGIALRLPTGDANMSLGFKVQRFLSGLGAREVAARHQTWLGAFDDEGARAMLHPDLRAATRDVSPLDALDMLREECRDASRFDAMLHFYQRFYMCGSILTKVDSASMAVSLEVRSPFLDQDLADYVNRLPRAHKLRGLTRKVLLRRLMRSRMPDALLKRPKKGFGLPLARWFRHELRPLVTAMLDPGRVALGGLLDPVTVERMVRDHLSGRRDHRKEIWSALCVEAWRERYLHHSRATASDTIEFGTTASGTMESGTMSFGTTPRGDGHLITAQAVPARSSAAINDSTNDSPSWAASPSRHRCNDSI